MAEFRVAFTTYTAVSIAMTAFLVLYTWLLYEEMYTVVAVLTSAKLALAILYNFAFMLLLTAGRAALRLLLGQLRDLEVEQLLDSGRGFLLDTVLFLVLSSPTLEGADVSTHALSKFLFLIVALKTAHLLVQIRGSTMFEVGHPRTSALLRLCLLLFGLLLGDICAVQFFFTHASKQSTFYVWLLFECLGMLASCAICILKFAAHVVDVRLENGWTSKSAVIFYLELMHDVTSLVIFLLFMSVFFFTQPSRLPLYMTADIIHVVKALYKRILSFKKYRSLTRNLETRFPDATAEELEAADTCIICRDYLFEGSKKLPCSHILHIDCLRSWLVQQQSCPTCRADIPIEDPPAPLPAASTTTQTTESQSAPAVAAQTASDEAGSDETTTGSGDTGSGGGPIGSAGTSGGGTDVVGAPAPDSVASTLAGASESSEESSCCGVDIVQSQLPQQLISGAGSSKTCGQVESTKQVERQKRGSAAAADATASARRSSGLVASFSSLGAEQPVESHNDDGGRGLMTTAAESTNASPFFESRRATATSASTTAAYSGAGGAGSGSGSGADVSSKEEGKSPSGPSRKNSPAAAAAPSYAAGAEGAALDGVRENGAAAVSSNAAVTQTLIQTLQLAYQVCDFYRLHASLWTIEAQRAQLEACRLQLLNSVVGVPSARPSSVVAENAFPPTQKKNSTASSGSIPTPSPLPAAAGSAVPAPLRATSDEATAAAAAAAELHALASCPSPSAQAPVTAADLTLERLSSKAACAVAGDAAAEMSVAAPINKSGATERQAATAVAENSQHHSASAAAAGPPTTPRGRSVGPERNVEYVIVSPAHVFHQASASSFLLPFSSNFYCATSNAAAGVGGLESSHGWPLSSDSHDINVLRKKAGNSDSRVLHAAGSSRSSSAMVGLFGSVGDRSSRSSNSSSALRNSDKATGSRDSRSNNNNSSLSSVIGSGSCCKNSMSSYNGSSAAGIGSAMSASSSFANVSSGGVVHDLAATEALSNPWHAATALHAASRQAASLLSSRPTQIINQSATLAEVPFSFFERPPDLGDAAIKLTIPTREHAGDVIIDSVSSASCSHSEVPASDTFSKTCGETQRAAETYSDNTPPQAFNAIINSHTVAQSSSRDDKECWAAALDSCHASAVVAGSEAATGTATSCEEPSRAQRVAAQKDETANLHNIQRENSNPAAELEEVRKEQHMRWKSGTNVS